MGGYTKQKTAIVCISFAFHAHSHTVFLWIVGKFSQEFENPFYLWFDDVADIDRILLLIPLHKPKSIQIIAATWLYRYGLLISPISTHLIFIRAISMHWELMWIIIYPGPLAVWQNSVQKTVSPPRLHVKLHIHIVNFFNAVKLRWMDWYIEISIRWMFVSEFKVLWKIGFSFSSNSIHDLFISIALCNQSHWLHICELISDLFTWQVVRLYESKYDEQNNPDRY